MNYEEIEKYILDIPRFTEKHSLDYTAEFLEKLGNPQKHMRIIHVAGTNGKGSVCAFISSILCKCGKRTGLFTSPHLIEITERISINGINVSKEMFALAFMHIKALADEMGNIGIPHPSYFEFLFLMAMDIFGREGVEFAVLETGLGGLLDATNAVEKPEVCVITSVGFDHMEILGNTIDEIAAQKAGIIKPFVPVIYQGENPAVNRIIEAKARDLHSPAFKCTGKDYKIIKKSNNNIDFCPLCGYYLNYVFSIPFIAEYQVENAMLALRAAEMLDDINHDIENVMEGIKDVAWPGRMEQVMPGVYFDGAHNGPGIDEFVKTISSFECSGNKNILFSAVAEKDYKYMSEVICREVCPAKVYVTRIKGSRGLSPDIIAGGFAGTDIYVSDNIEDTFFKALKEKKEGDVLFCVGSLYLVGELKKIIRDRIVEE